MTAFDLHNYLADRGLTVRVDAGKLLVSPKAKLTDDLSSTIRENKGGLLAYLEPPACVEWLLLTGEIVASRFGVNWFRPGEVLSWRTPPNVAWQALKRLPVAWGLADPEVPDYDPFASTRVTKVGTCYHCGGVEFWTSEWGVTRCARCVPRQVSG